MAYPTYHCSTTSRCSFCHTAFLHISLALSVLLWFILCGPCQFTAQFLFRSIQLLHNLPSSRMNHFPHQQTPPLEQQQQQKPHLFSVPCIYSFCAPCACSVRNASACWLRAVILHLSSALSDHHRDSSASLVVHPACPALLYVILRFLSLSGSLRLFIFSETVELLIFIDLNRRFMILMNQRSWSHRDLASRCSFDGVSHHSKPR